MLNSIWWAILDPENSLIYIHENRAVVENVYADYRKIDGAPYKMIKLKAVLNES